MRIRKQGNREITSVLGDGETGQSGAHAPKIKYNWTDTNLHRATRPDGMNFPELINRIPMSNIRTKDTPVKLDTIMQYIVDNERNI